MSLADRVREEFVGVSGAAADAEAEIARVEAAMARTDPDVLEMHLAAVGLATKSRRNAAETIAAVRQLTAEFGPLLAVLGGL